jgi:glutaredoxin 1
MIVIYGRMGCSYCTRAKEICEQYKLNYVYKDMSYSVELYEEFQAKFPNAKTVPQITWDDNHIGGYTELVTHIENLSLGNYGEGAF